MTTSDAANNPANRLGLDYRRPPAFRFARAITDFHTHVYAVPTASLLREAADAYGVGRILSMSPLKDVPALREDWGERLAFIAIPNWKEYSNNEDFRRKWLDDLAKFREHGSRICKFWMAPRMRKEHGLTADHAFMRPVVDRALELDYEFMIHVADPTAWWAPGGKYAEDPAYGSKSAQYAQLDWLCDYVAPRRVVAAHLAGSVEEPKRLDALLTQHANLFVDCSATKWITRGVAADPEGVRAVLIRHADRVLFGSDLVVAEKYDTFDHYASRYWVQRTMWEGEGPGESPIEDPDAADPPVLAGLNLPDDVLEKLYATNIEQFDFWS